MHVGRLFALAHVHYAPWLFTVTKCIVASLPILLSVCMQNLPKLLLTDYLGVIGSTELIVELDTSIQERFLVVSEFRVTGDRYLLQWCLANHEAEMLSIIISERHVIKAAKIKTNEQVLLARLLLSNLNVSFFGHTSSKIAPWAEHEACWVQLWLIIFRAVFATSLSVKPDVVVFLEAASHGKATLRLRIFIFDVPVPTLMQEANVVINSGAELRSTNAALHLMLDRLASRLLDTLAARHGTGGRAFGTIRSAQRLKVSSLHMSDLFIKRHFSHEVTDLDIIILAAAHRLAENDRCARLLQGVHASV